MEGALGGLFLEKSAAPVGRQLMGSQLGLHLSWLSLPLDQILHLLMKRRLAFS